MPGEFGTPKAHEVLAEWAETNGYVKLSKDQILPGTLTSIVDSINENTLRILLEAGWRKVKLEGKDDN